MDRTLIILDIFAGRAKTAEGKIQGGIRHSLDTVQQDLLVCEIYQRQGGGIGTRGPG